MWFKKSNKFKKQVYAVEGGGYLGYFLTVIDFDKKDKKYKVLGCKLDQVAPKAMDIPEKDMLEGIKNRLLTYVETVDRTVYRECKKQYNLLKSTK